MYVCVCMCVCMYVHQCVCCLLCLHMVSSTYKRAIFAESGRQQSAHQTSSILLSRNFRARLRASQFAELRGGGGVPPKFVSKKHVTIKPKTRINRCSAGLFGIYFHEVLFDVMPSLAVSCAPVRVWGCSTCAHT